MNITAMAKHRRSPIAADEQPADALARAVALWRQPGLARWSKHHDGAERMLLLIKLAAGDNEALSQAEQEFDLTAAEWREAAAFYLQTLLARKNAEDNYGLLCLPENASPELVHQHKRWLSKWLHPDRNPNQWESVLFLRIQKAAQTIENNVVPIVIPTQLKNRHTRGRGSGKFAMARISRQRSFSRTVGVAAPALVVVAFAGLTYLVLAGKLSMFSSVLQQAGLR